MIRVVFDPAPLARLARQLAGLSAVLASEGHDALYTAALHETQRIAIDTPRSSVNHPHLQDRWTVTDHGDAGVSIDNLTGYAGYVAKEPDHFGARVEAHYDRQLHASLQAAPDHIRDELSLTLPAIARRAI